jgi:hypothetical protein
MNEWNCYVLGSLPRAEYYLLDWWPLSLLELLPLNEGIFSCFPFSCCQKSRHDGGGHSGQTPPAPKPGSNTRRDGDDEQTGEDDGRQLGAKS